MLTSDTEIIHEIRKHSSNGELSCSSAFFIAEKLDISPLKVGMTADLINCRLVKCQMGLFGYKPIKKIVKPLETADQNLKNAIINNLVKGRLACKTAWDIAYRYKLNKMSVSAICEGMNIKINKCQLGAF